MTSTLAVTEQRPLTDSGGQLHGTLPPAAIAAILPHAPIPAEVAFEAWEDGAYVLAYLQHAGLR